MRFELIMALGAIACSALAAPAVENSAKVAIEHQGLTKPSNHTDPSRPKLGNRTKCIKEKNLRIMPLGGTHPLYFYYFI